MTDIKSAIILHMEASGIGYAELAKKQGVPRQLIFKTLNGESHMRISTAQQLAKDIGAEIKVTDKAGNEAIQLSADYLTRISKYNIRITVEDMQLILRPLKLQLQLVPKEN